jgi:hypothetical protein
VLERLLDVGAVYDKHVFRGRAGELIVSVDAHLGGDGIPPNLGLTRPDLHDALIVAAADAGATVRYGTRPVAIEEAGERVEVELADGSRGAYDLVAAFDGIHSEMRRRLFADAHEPVHTGNAVGRVPKPRDEGTDQLALYQGVLAKAGHIAISEELMYLLLVVPSAPEIARLAIGTPISSAATSSSSTRSPPTFATPWAMTTTSSSARSRKCGYRCPGTKAASSSPATPPTPACPTPLKAPRWRSRTASSSPRK